MIGQAVVRARPHRLPRVLVLGVLLTSLLWAASPGAAIALEAAATPAERWIVMTDDPSGPDRAARDARDTLAVRAERTFRHAFNGFSASLTAGQRAALLRRPGVRAIVPDTPVRLAAQTLPKNVNRVDADRSPVADIGGDGGSVDADIAIIDTGIDPNHPDLNVVGGVDCSGGDGSSWSDGHGHGTHVAGTAAARDNGFGVVGVAPGARLWSVRVFNARAESYFSWIVCGLEWVASRRDPADAGRPLIEVASMSLRGAGSDDGRCGTTNFDAVHQAVCAAVSAGVTVTAAAGNDRRNAKEWVPASYDEVITVSAISDSDGRPGGDGATVCQGDRDDTFADFSNYGPDVDIAAPGLCVLSTLRGGGYGGSTGTSMATPAVAGGAALYRAGHQAASPAQVRAALLQTGRLDWATGTDPDDDHEPVLNVSDLDVGASFELAAGPTTQLGTPDDPAEYTVTTARVGGFDPVIQLSVSGLPAGASADFAPASLEAGENRSTLEVTLPSGGPYGTYDLAIRADGGPRVVVRHVQLVFSPAVDGAGPKPGFVKGSKLGEYMVPMEVAWRPVAGADAYQLQESEASGAWQAISLPSARATRVEVGGWPHRLYRYRLRTKSDGAWGSWSTSIAVAPRPFHELGYGIEYRGSWSTVRATDAYGGRTRATSDAGATATFQFTGRRFAWVATRAPNRGRAAVSIDGQRIRTVDLYSSSRRPRTVVFETAWASNEMHTVVIRNLGTAGRRMIDLDVLFAMKSEE